MKRLLLPAAVVAAAALYVGASGAASGSARQSPTSTPAYCNPCLYYSGDFDPNAALASSLANQKTVAGNDAKVYTPVVPDVDWSVTALFQNSIVIGGIIDPASTSWEIRTGVSSGNGGTVYASGTATATYTATGRFFSGPEYDVKVPLSPAVQLHAGTKYYVNVQPQCLSGSCTQFSQYYETNVEPFNAPVNHVGPTNVLNDSFFNSAFYGANFVPAVAEAGCCFQLFSFGVVGTPATGTLEVVNILQPAYDPGRFNLRIDGVTYKANAANGGTTGPVTVPYGAHTVSETAGVNTDPARYTAHIVCSDGSSGYGTSLSGVAVPPGGSVICTITNTRRLFKI